MVSWRAAGDARVLSGLHQGGDKEGGPVPKGEAGGPDLECLAFISVASCCFMNSFGGCTSFLGPALEGARTSPKVEIRKNFGRSEILIHEAQ